MATFEEIIKMAEADGGKFFVLDETGDPKLVIMPVADYQRLLLGKLQRQVNKQGQDIERINSLITKAQLQEREPAPKDYSAGGRAAVPAVKPRPAVQLPDLRAEVIDPSFDFEGPKTNPDEI